MSGAEASGPTLQAAVGERLDNLTTFKARFWAPLVLGLIMLGDSWDSIVIAYVMPSLREEWALNPLMIGWIISAGFGGQFLGALILGPLAERFGRMPVFHTAITMMCVLSIACAMAPDPNTFLMFRAAQGFAIGGALPVCISYINELAPTQTRGRYFSIFQFIMVSGFSLASLASAFIIPEFGWRMMFILGALPVLLTPLVMLTLPESPRWHARYGRIDATNKALASLGAAPVESARVGEVPRATPVAALFTPEYRQRTIVMSSLWFLTSLVSFAFATWVPSLYVQVFNVSIENSLRYSAIAGGLYLFVPLVFAAIIDRFGRRGPAILAGAIASSALVALIFIDHAQTPLVVTLITTGWVAAAAGSIILWPYTADVFPTHIRAAGLGLSSSLARGASMLTPLVVGGVLSATGAINAVFGLLALSAFVMTLVWVFFTRETARRSLEEIGKA